MVDIVVKRSVLHFCYLSEVITFEEALNLLNQCDMEVTDSDSCEDISLPKETDSISNSEV
jgi:hypothetical protein